MTTSAFEEIVSSLPDAPGVYKYFDINDIIIYIGKAKNLKKRISSYFKTDQLNAKTTLLVKSIARIEFVIVDTEHDALLLENNFIKQHQPKYNINLKDDKTFPYIVIKKEPFPRVFFSRQKRNDGATYLGPYTNVMATRLIYNLVAEQFQLRSCHLNLAQKKIAEKKYKVCLDYHIKKCKGPCEGLQTEEDYNTTITDIKFLLKNNFKEIIQSFTHKMYDASAALEFELAQSYKKKIELIEAFSAKSIIEATSPINIDVFALEILNTTGLVHYMKVREGKIVATQNIQLETKLDEPKEDLLQFAIVQIYLDKPCEVSEVILPFDLIDTSFGFTILVPQRGDKKNFLDLAIKNLQYLKFEVRRLKMNFDDAIEKDKQLVLEQLQKDLYLQNLPVHIECFDNSNFQGSYPVSAMVCFKNGHPSKNDYRIFKVKTVQGIDDFATMREVIYRRYKKLKETNSPLPNLIIIDGGKGQLNAALESLQILGMQNQFTVIGLAKNKEEIFFPHDKESLLLNYTSDSLKLITQIRDEVHRFGIQFHRKLREKGTIKTVLNNIDGIGEFTAQKLLKHFGSVQQIKQQSEVDLAFVIGTIKARLVKNYFSSNQ